MTKLTVSFLVLASLFIDLPAYAAEPNCKDILRFGVFDESAYRENTSIQKQFEEALCDTNFETHQEARNYGIGVAVPVYGVPVELTGSFDKSSKDQWFRQHCKQNASKEDFRQFIASQTRKASPVIVEAWSRCMTAQIGLASTGLLCGVVAPSATDIVFSAEWRKAYEEDVGPKVNTLRVFGAECGTYPIPRGLATRYTLQCKRSSMKETATFLLEAGRSQCLLSVPGFDTSCKEKRFKGTTTLDANTTVNCDRIVFEDGAIVRVTNGARLSLNARDAIQVDGTAKIDGTGNDGAPGDPGASIGGEWISQGDDDYWPARGDCAARSDHPDRGKGGGKGRPGGAGATIILSKMPTGTLTVEIGGGKGGPGGPGGGGRLLKNGRNFYCDGCMFNCPSGPQGPEGDRGPDGSYTLLEEEPTAEPPR